MLHAFQTVPFGVRTAKRDVDSVAERLKATRRITRSTMAGRNAESGEPIPRGAGNVFADLGFPDAGDRQAKLRLSML